VRAISTRRGPKRFVEKVGLMSTPQVVQGPIAMPRPKGGAPVSTFGDELIIEPAAARGKRRTLVGSVTTK